jgi:hypothetical protein
MSQKYWSEWVHDLGSSPFMGLYLFLLEGSGPLKLMIGQVLLAGKVFASPSSQEKWLEAAEMLENDAQSKAFAFLLREENNGDL